MILERRELVHGAPHADRRGARRQDTRVGEPTDGETEQPSRNARRRPHGEITSAKREQSYRTVLADHARVSDRDGKDARNIIAAIMIVHRMAQT